MQFISSCFHFIAASSESSAPEVVPQQLTEQMTMQGVIEIGKGQAFKLELRLGHSTLIMSLTVFGPHFA